MAPLPRREEMYRAFVERDAAYDGVFYTGVRTTGIYCRPTCAARKPRPENVVFFATADEAERAGLRACRRCRPVAPPGEHPRWVRQLLALVDAQPDRRWSDAALREAGVSPARARRYFREVFGMTFHAYQRARSLGRALDGLRRGDTVDAVSFDAGFESVSGFRDAFAGLFGEPPGRARSAECLRSTLLATPLGPMVAVAGEDGLALLEFWDRPALRAQARALRRHTSAPVVPGTGPVLERLTDELARYFAGTLRRFETPLALAGTEFQRRVWERLLAIPYGATLSYGELARELGRPGAQRAVGRANGDNRLAILVPCHRVVQADGALRGYGGGLWRKRRLLDLERAAAGVRASATR